MSSDNLRKQSPLPSILSNRKSRQVAPSGAQLLLTTSQVSFRGLLGPWLFPGLTSQPRKCPHADISLNSMIQPPHSHLLLAAEGSENYSCHRTQNASYPHSFCPWSAATGPTGAPCRRETSASYPAGQAPEGQEGHHKESPHSGGWNKLKQNLL